jgi:predicted metallopeptidase
MGNTLTVISAPAKKTIEIGLTNLNLSEVTYVEGTSTVQNILIRFSGMQGMVGNKLFLNQILIIDCKSEKFKIE